MDKLKVASWNMNGINYPIKRKNILSHLSKEKVDTALLKESHLSVLEASKLRQSWVGHVVASPADGKNNGVIVLFNLQLQILSSVDDPLTRWAEVRFKIGDKEYALINIYAANQDDRTFWKALHQSPQSPPAASGRRLQLPCRPTT